MAISKYSRPAKTAYIPLDLAPLAKLQEMRYRGESELAETAYKQQLSLMQLEQQKSQQVKQGILGQQELFGKIRGYSKEDQDLLARRKAVYTGAISTELDKLQKEGESLSKLSPFIERLNYRLRQEATSGDIYDVSYRYNLAQEDLKALRSYQQTHVEPLWMKRERESLVGTGQRLIPYTNIAKEVSTFLTSTRSPQMSEEEFYAIGRGYAYREFADQLRVAKKYGYESDELIKIDTAIANKYREVTGGGPGTLYTSGLETFVSETFKGTGEATAEHFRNLGEITPTQAYEYSQEADKILETQHFGVDTWSKKKIEANNEPVYQQLKENMRGIKILSDGYRKVVQYADFDFNIDEQEEFKNNFWIIGGFKSNPYFPAGIYATTTVDGEQISMVISNTVEKASRESLFFKLGAGMYDAKTRMEGEGEWYDIPRTPKGNRVQLIPQIEESDGRYTWGSYVKVNVFDKEGEEPIIMSLEQFRNTHK